ncbi:dapper homolog 1 [Polymixia lowei]
MRDGDLERTRTRERLEATLSGLGELDYLRHRQEVLVQNALNVQEDAVSGARTGDQERAGNVTHQDNLSSEEKLVEENILLLRKQLNCLRRRDAGLISQLQELDRQISDLRLDTEASHDLIETDSRPSSGFYELSDGASGSLSNSSNSVFSECLSSCRSSTCFCSAPDSSHYPALDSSHGPTLDSSHCSTDGRLRSTDELVSCMEWEGLCDDQTSSGTVRRSLSVPYPPALDTPTTSSCDSQSRYQCDPLGRNGSDLYRYPSPLHAVQSPVFLHALSAGLVKDQGLATNDYMEGQKAISIPPPPPLPPLPRPPVSALLVPQSTSWPAPSSSSSTSQNPFHKRLDSYILGLLQRRAQPVRTSQPRTSISTDPAKSVLRQGSLCVRQGPGLKPNWNRCGSPAGAGTSSLQRQWSVESKGGEQDSGGCQTQNGYPVNNSDMAQNGFQLISNDLAPNQNGYSISNSGVQNESPLSNSVQIGYSINNNDIYINASSLLKRKGLFSANKGLLHSTTSTGTLPKDYKELGSPKANSSPKQQPSYPGMPVTDQEPLISPQIAKTQSATSKKSPKPLPSGQIGKGDRSVPELISLGSSSQSQDECGGGGTRGAHMVKAEYIPGQQQPVKLRKGTKNVRVVKVKGTTPMKASRTSEHGAVLSETVVVRRGDKQNHRSSSRKSRLSEDVSSTHHKVPKRATGGAPGVSRIKRIPASIPEGQVLDKHTTSTMTSTTSSRAGVSRQHHGHHGSHHHYGGNHHHHHGNHHHHGREPVVVVAKPKYKRNDYRRLRAITEVPYDEAFRRALRRQRRELLSHLPSRGQYSSPYSYVAGSDSEYSAECASLFHSTIMDTSEDERSNYTTNRFGDSESSMSEEELVGESTTTTDSEESGGGTGGMGRGWSQLGAAGSGTAGQEMSPAQAKAFVKIKASHNLKRRILRFRSGSLKLMTTV